MTLVQKYGGTSVGDTERIRAVARRVAATRAEDSRLVVVVSAMGDTTDRLLGLARDITSNPADREIDMLMSAGETITAPLLTLALQSLGVEAIALSGFQAGIQTSSDHRAARITDIDTHRLDEELSAGRVVVVAGFQGMSAGFDITTLGRGGSDTSAVALAVALKADACEIYTDVEGVFTADPRICADARLLPEVSYEEMLELAAVGARVMHPRAVEIASAYRMPLWVRSSSGEGRGTLIHGDESMEIRPRVRGIAHDTNVAKITLLRVPDRPGIAARLFGALGTADINVDLIVQNVSHDGTTDVSFTIAASDLPRTEHRLHELVADLGAAGLDANDQIGTVSIVGSGIRGAPGVFASAFTALADAGINIELISTSEIHLTCVVSRDRVPDAVAALHRTFVEAEVIPSAPAEAAPAS